MSNKNLFLILLCTLSLVLSACGSTEEPPTAASEPTPIPTAAEPETAEADEENVEAENDATLDADGDGAVAESDADADIVEFEEDDAGEPEEDDTVESDKDVAVAESEEDDVVEPSEDTVADEPEENTSSEVITNSITSTEEVVFESVVGELTFPSLGNVHIPFGSRTPVEYNTTPPSSGPHYSNIIEWDIYDKPIPYELLVHNLEDGGVVVYYQCEEPCPELVQQLTDAIAPYLEYDWHVVMAPNDPYDVSEDKPFQHLDMGAKIAVVAWQKVLKLDEFDSDTILLFLEAYQGIDNHDRG